MANSCDAHIKSEKEATYSVYNLDMIKTGKK